VHVALAIGRRLSMGEARQSGFVNAAEFAVNVGRPLRLGARAQRPRLGISPLVEACAGEQLHPAIVDAGSHPIAVSFYFVQPLRS
jgi:hypothetical protein